MTRINTIPPKQLQDAHLLSEYREICRIPNMARKRTNDGHPMNDIPDTYRLGTGHVRFFLDKLEYIHERMLDLRFEIVKRNLKPIDYDYAQLFNDSMLKLYNDWSPLKQDHAINIERIVNNTKKQKKAIRYYKNTITLKEYLQILKS